MDKRKGFFISYKSENAGLARTVAESLKAHGVQVWFAEYEVLLGNYDDFQTAIDCGIDASKYALLFTTNQWAESRWCQVEIARILQRIPLDRVLRVNLPAEDGDKAEIDDGKRHHISDVHDKSTNLKQWHIDYILKKRAVHRTDLVRHKETWMEERHPTDTVPDMFDVRVPPAEWPRQVSLELARVVTIDCRAYTNVNELISKVLHLIASHTKLLPIQSSFPPQSSPTPSSWWPCWRKQSSPAPSTASVGTGRKEFLLFGLAFSLDFGEWELTSPGCTASDGGNFNGPTFGSRFDGAVCEGRIVIGQGIPSLQATAEAMSSVDDRERYRHVRRFAQAFEQSCREAHRIEIKNCGLHIVRLDAPERRNPKTHAAFTCRLGGRVMPHWQRRYSIAVIHPVPQTLFEFSFTFDFFGSFDKFLRYAFSMERIVTSLRFRTP